MSDSRESQPVPISTAYVCAYVVRKVGNSHEFLLLKRQSRYMHGLWGQVAGKVEAGETAAQAALREIREEAGQTPVALYSADIVESFYDIEFNTIQMIPAFVAFFDTTDVILSHEHSEYRWVSPAEARTLFPFPLQRSTVETIVREFLEKEPPDHLRIPLS